MSKPDDDNDPDSWAEVADGLYEALRNSAEAQISVEGKAAILRYEAKYHPPSD